MWPWRPRSWHPSALVWSRRTVHPSVQLGAEVLIWHYVTILAETVIGNRCRIASHVDIGARCQIGEGTVMQAFVQIPHKAVIGRWVFLGPSVTLCDCNRPMIQDKMYECLEPPVIEDEAIIGANAVLMPGVRIGQGAFVGAGSVVLRDVPPGALVMGNPALVHTLDSPHRRGVTYAV